MKKTFVVPSQTSIQNRFQALSFMFLTLCLIVFWLVGANPKTVSAQSNCPFVTESIPIVSAIAEQPSQRQESKQR